MRSGWFLGAFATLAVLTAACYDDPGESAFDGTPISYVSFDEAVDLSATGQVTYRIDRPGAKEKGGGLAVLRTAGDIARWDEQGGKQDLLIEGSYVVTRFLPSPGNYDTFGCLWVSEPDDRRAVLSECSEGAEAAFNAFYFDVIWAGKVFNETDLEELEAPPAACYQNGSDIVAFCVDDERRLLSFRFGTGGTEYRAEVIEVSDQVEPFASPFELAVLPTASTFDTARSVDEFDFPSAFRFDE